MHVARHLIPDSYLVFNLPKAFPRPRLCSGQADKRIMHLHVEQRKMPQFACQPVALGGGGDDDVGEAVGMALASGAL
jgi:hypothetical protein